MLPNSRTRFRPSSPDFLRNNGARSISVPLLFRTGTFSELAAELLRFADRRPKLICLSNLPALHGCSLTLQQKNKTYRFCLSLPHNQTTELKYYPQDLFRHFVPHPKSSPPSATPTFFDPSDLTKRLCKVLLKHL